MTKKRVTLNELKQLTKYTEKRIKKAQEVLKDPSDKNLRAYNHVVEIHDELRKRTGIYPVLTKEEEAASLIWLSRSKDIEWY